MSAGKWLKGQDQRRLRLLLGGLFVALALPTAVLVQQAFAQLKWESFYQHRLQAEDVTARIDAALSQSIAQADGRAFSDYAFVSAVSANVVQRSPLSAFPAVQDVPGVIGYFQVSPDGTFSSPLVPDADIAETGVFDEELASRRELAAHIESVLADNELVRRDNAANGRRAQIRQPTNEFPDRNAPGAPKESLQEEASATPVDFDFSGNSAPAAVDEIEEVVLSADSRYDQVVFDQLNQRSGVDQYNNAGDNFTENRAEPAQSRQTAIELRANSSATPQRMRKIQDLNLDDSLQKLDLERKRESADATGAADSPPAAAEVARLQAPEAESPALPAANITVGESDRVGQDNAPAIITTFQGETDRFEFSMLDSGHFVLFRKVWRNGERFIQGALIDQLAFVNSTIESAFRASSLSDMSDLVLAYEDDILRVFPGRQNSSYPPVAAQLDGSLLYRSRLGAPLDRLELVYSVNRLPPGPGAVVLGWTTVVIGLVFAGGFFALYRLGLSQVRLAQQQQDFVSAVSHELKTPLTSIRMYGEMLKEGWVDDDKRRQYYDYIHDESERLTRLISNVLQLANISRNQPGIAAKPTRVAALLDQVRSKIASQTERAGFAIEFRDNPDALESTIEIDPDCFLQIVINLVDNAIKFSRSAERKTIEITTRLASDGFVEFHVRDYGPGIPKSQIRKIFRLFYRSESELTRETVGTGIGLAIVHQLASAMNGSVDVQNMDPGAEFRLRFPVLAG